MLVFIGGIHGILGMRSDEYRRDKFFDNNLGSRGGGMACSTGVLEFFHIRLDSANKGRPLHQDKALGGLHGSKASLAQAKQTRLDGEAVQRE